MRWLVDTSAWARRDQAGVAEGLRRLLESGDVLVLSPSVLLELMRGPQGSAVAVERTDLEQTMAVVAADAETFQLAADAMAALAERDPRAHRKPVPDLITAALAHQYKLGVVHCDADFVELAEHGGLDFEQRHLTIAAAEAGAHPTANRQRALRRELAELLHRAPVEQAEALLERAVAEARGLAAGA